MTGIRRRLRQWLCALAGGHVQVDEAFDDDGPPRCGICDAEVGPGGHWYLTPPPERPPLRLLTLIGLDLAGGTFAAGWLLGILR